jgi:hypothetical protein
MSDVVEAGFGLSTKTDPNEAGREAASMAMEGLTKPCFAIVFASPSYRDFDGVLGEIMRVIGKNVPLTGSTTGAPGGITLCHEGWIDKNVAILLLESDHLNASVGVGENASETPREAGKAAVLNAFKQMDYNPYKDLAKLPAKHSPFTVIMQDDGYQRVVDYEIRGIIDAAGRVPVIGGSAGDDGTLGKSYVFCNGKAYTNAISTAVLAGDVKFGFSCAVGWKPVPGKVAEVTKGDGYSEILELDGKPAGVVYSEWTGVPVDELKETAKWKAIPGEAPMIYYGCINPLGVVDQAYPEFVWLKHPYIYLKENDGFKVGGIVPLHQTLHLCEVTADEIIETNVKKVEEAKAYEGIKKVAAMIGFNCVERYTMLGYTHLPQVYEGADKKAISELVKAVGKDVPIIGNGGAWGEQMFSHTGNVGMQNLSLCTLLIGNELAE